MPANFLIDDLNMVLASQDFGETDGCNWEGKKIDNVIFDDEDVEAVVGEGIVNIIPQPMITGRSADFKGIKEDDKIVIRNETLYVSNWKDDGTGVIEIMMYRKDQ